MDFVMPQWVADVSPWALSVMLILLLATGRLTRFHTARVESDADKRVEDLKESHARELKQKDDEIAHLRATAKSLAESVAVQSETQREQLQTADVVRTVMQNLQAQARGHTGPVRKVTEGVDK